VLDAELVEIDQPTIGFTFTVHSTVRYTLRDINTRKSVMDEIIKTSGTATTGDAFAGVTRLRIATERSAQENLQKLINKLYIYKG
jgi:hypothetical protein